MRFLSHAQPKQIASNTTPTRCSDRLENPSALKLEHPQINNTLSQFYYIGVKTIKNQLFKWLYQIPNHLLNISTSLTEQSRNAFKGNAYNPQVIGLMLNMKLKSAKRWHFLKCEI